MSENLKIIVRYAQAARAWYQHQHDGQLLRVVNTLQRRARRAAINDPSLRPLYLKAHYNTHKVQSYI